MLYIMSQIFVIISYILLIATYQLNNRKKILIFNFASTIAIAISYTFLSAYTGLSMTLVALIRNIIFLIDKKSKNITSKDVGILIILYAISIYFAIITYDGFFSLMSVCATMIYTYSVWQKNTNAYKFLGIFVGLSAIIYNIYISSLFGVFFESLLTISAMIGFFKESSFKKKKSLAFGLEAQN